MPNGAKHYAFTLNNFTQDEIDLLRKLFDHGGEATGLRYLVFQQEKGEQETPHIQGYISFSKRISLHALKKMVGNRAHVEVCRGSPSQNRDYCTKPESRIPGTEFEEFGEIPDSKGVRTDLADFMKAVKEGETCTKNLREQFFDVFAKYPRFCIDYIQDNMPIPDIPNHTLHHWQQVLQDKLSETPNDREILFVIDEKGNKGKTWFAKYYCRENPTAFFLEPSKKADMAHAIPTEMTHLFINLTRSQAEKSEYLYSFLESVKDGRVFSPKYESRMKYLKPCHVVVMMNSEPMTHLLSSDRITKIHI